jgi:hypothetical protein
VTNFSLDPVPFASWNLESTGRVRSGPRIRQGSAARETVWSLLAADSAGDRVLLSLVSGESSQIFLASATAPPVKIPFDGFPVAAAFAPGANSVFVADAAGHRIVAVANLQTSPALTTLVSSAVYVGDPAAMAVSSDGNRLFVADRADSLISMFDLSAAGAGNANPLLQLATGAAPESLTAFSPDRFLLNAENAGGTAAQPLYFLDTGVSARVAFVPRGE